VPGGATVRHSARLLRRDDELRDVHGAADMRRRRHAESMRMHAESMP
jgi:hypothetical protein